MALYNITYELKGADTDYASFYSILRSENAYNQCLKNSWFIISDKSRAELYNILKSCLGNNDLILIVETDLGQMSGWLPSDSVGWLTKNKSV